MTVGTNAARTARLGPGRLLPAVVIAVLTLYLVFIGGGWYGIYSVDLRQVSIILAAAVIAVWLAVAAVRPVCRPQSRIGWAFAVCLAAFAIGTALSRQPRLGIEYLCFAIVLTALYGVMRAILSDQRLARPFVRLSVVLALLVGGAYVVSVGSAWIDWWRLVGRVATPPLRPEFEGLSFGNPSAVLTMSVLLTSTGVAVIGFATRGRTTASVALIALSLVVTLMSGSRAGWLAVAVAVLVIAIAWLAEPDRRRMIGRLISTRSRRSVALAAAGALLASVAAIALLPGILLRALGGGGEAGRAAWFEAALRMFADSPVHGTGPGTWVAQRVLYTQANEIDYYIPHAHSIYLQTLAEFGLLGGAGGLAIAAAVLLLVRDGMRNQDPTIRRVAWTTAFAAVYFAAHQALDFYANMPAALFAMALPIAWLDAATDSPAKTMPRAGRRWLQLAVVGVGVAIAITGARWSERSAEKLAEAVRLVNASDSTAARSIAARAVELDPTIPPDQLTLGMAAAGAGDDATAERAFETAARADDLPEAWLALADVSARLGHHAKATDSLERAMRLGRQQPAVAMAAADLYGRLGDEGAADDAFVAALIAAPGLGGDAFWQTDSRLGGRGPTIVDRAIKELVSSGSTVSAVELALVAGETPRSYDLAATLAEADRTTMHLVIAAWTGDTSAFESLKTAAKADPFDLVTVYWCARLSARAGDRAAADRYERWAATVASSTPRAGQELRVAHGPIAPTEIAGYSVSFYGHYTYLRPTPWNMIPADLIQLRWE
jgi:O-antigen ligase